jgi:phage terminase small subunit
MKRGRKSAAERAMAPMMVAHEPVPVQPPPSLSEPARRVFLDLVSSVDPAHFQQSDVGLLCQYCEAQVMAERAAAELSKGEGPPNTRWLAAWREGTRTMKDLALRLRLSPQSRREKAKVERPLTWDERFRLERFGRL